MPNTRPTELLHAIEKLINEKMCDALIRPDGLARLAAHRASGVVSLPIRNAERDLETIIRRCLQDSDVSNH